mmetsp:Transcript_1010/g.3744  ORF Transcript_1010/g.3744 Transcript_1010/m.3744 type:complete len:244 (-) Transcript_1010:232-963(-)
MLCGVHDARGRVRRRPRVELLQRGHLLHALRHVLVALQERLHLHQVGRVRVSRRRKGVHGHDLRVEQVRVGRVSRHVVGLHLLVVGVGLSLRRALRGRVRGFRVLLPRGRHGVNLACDAVCPMGLSTQSLERRRCSLLELGTKGTLGYLTCENSRRPGRRCARRVENRRSSGRRASKTPRDYWVYNRARRPDGSTARPRTRALERLRCVRGPGHADVRTLRGVLFTKCGRRRVTVSRRARDCE